MLYRCTPLVALLSVCGLAACAETTGSSIDELRKRKDAGVSIDASPIADASSTTLGGVIACYTEGAPSTTCTLPVHCCWTNYSSQHDGYCSTDACAWGTETCDGPEDCAAGEVCCSRAIFDTSGDKIGYSMACSATACGAPPFDYELCHPSTGCSSGTCVTAYGNDNDLPPELYICQ